MKKIKQFLFDVLVAFPQAYAMLFIAIVIPLFFLVACGDPPPFSPPARINVEKVFQQQPGVYSFLYHNGKEIVSYSLGNFIPYYHLFDDAPEDGPMYIEVSEQAPYTGNGSRGVRTINIHVHSIKDVDTVGYSTGGKYPVYVAPKTVE